MTAEIQALWLTSKPILFVGVLRDIRDADNGNQILTVDYPEFGSHHSFVEAKLTVRAACSDELSEPLMALAKARKRSARFADVALIIKIQEVRSEANRVPGDDRETNFIGDGDCIDAIPLNVHLPREWLSRLNG